MTGNLFRQASLISLCTLHLSAEPAAKWSATETAGRIEAALNGQVLLGWQAKPLENPVGGAKFAASAFLHPLRTPAGFEWTCIQPADHKHHFGLWWPWKFIEVDGAKYNCWEIQEGQGGHVAKQVKAIPGAATGLAWDFHNQTEIRKAGGAPQAMIDETATVAIHTLGDAQVLDIQLKQKAIAAPVQISAYRYSGFSWRGPASWDKDNSTMTTSEGLGRDEANGKPARWVMVSGSTPKGHATVLLMSAASEVAGTAEKLRVWDSKAEKGTPFINFNPVMGKPLPLDDAHPAVSNRKYRIIAADRVIDSAAAEAEWKKWLGK